MIIFRALSPPNRQCHFPCRAYLVRLSKQPCHRRLRCRPIATVSYPFLFFDLLVSAPEHRRAGGNPFPPFSLEILDEETGATEVGCWALCIGESLKVRQFDEAILVHTRNRAHWRLRWIRVQRMGKLKRPNLWSKRAFTSKVNPYPKNCQKRITDSTVKCIRLHSRRSPINCSLGLPISCSPWESWKSIISRRSKVLTTFFLRKAAV